MSVTVAWELGAAVAVVLLITIYAFMQLNAVRNGRLINSAITAMRGAIGAEPAAQRALLQAVADILVAQDRAAARIEIVVHDLALRDPESAEPLPEPQDLIRALLALPEPQRLATEFLAEYAGAPLSGASFVAIAADLLHAAIAEVFADLAQDRPVELERLQVLGADGAVAVVAVAGLTAQVPPGMPPFRAPRVADLDNGALTAIFRALDSTTRRQLRLATLLHGQAEALLRVRGKELGVLARWRWRLYQVLRLPLLRRPQFTREDLEALVVAFDAVGEIVDAADKQLAGGEPTRAIQLLAELRMPVPAGLPGRMYHLESLAQAQPAAAFGVWHRLAVSRWLAASLAAVTTGAALAYWFGGPAESSERDACDAELALHAGHS